MPTQQRTIYPEISLVTSQNIKDARLSKKDERGKSWTMPKLSRELALHRCSVHPDGVDLSAAVINHIENRTGPSRHRIVSVDELWAFSEVLGVEPTILMGWKPRE